MHRDEIISIAREWLGTPYRKQGCRIGVGADCFAPFIDVLDRMGVAHTIPRDYSNVPDGKSIKEYCDRYLEPIDPADAIAGDLLILWFKRLGKEPQHAVLLTTLPDGRLGALHAWDRTKNPQVLETGFPEQHRHRVVLAYRFPGVV